MLSSPRRVVPAIRLTLARRPWIRWFAIACAALGAGWLVLGQLQEVDAARRAWTDQQTVFVAARDHEPGETLEVEARRLPAAAIPGAALDVEPVAETVRQRVAAGEIITDVDVVDGVGPAAMADAGEVVVAVSDPLLADVTERLTVGVRVAIHSEGVVMAERAHIVAVDGEVVFVAVDQADAPGVSAAAQLRQASLAFPR